MPDASSPPEPDWVQGGAWPLSLSVALQVLILIMLLILIAVWFPSSPPQADGVQGATLPQGGVPLRPGLRDGALPRVSVAEIGGPPPFSRSITHC